MHARESVAVVVSTIRNTGALDRTWSATGSRSEVVEQARAWQDQLPGRAPEPSVADVVGGLPPEPAGTSWVMASGRTTGQFWVWVTSTDSDHG